jgi:hypothetical protein
LELSNLSLTVSFVAGNVEINLQLSFIGEALDHLSLVAAAAL